MKTSNSLFRTALIVILSAFIIAPAAIAANDSDKDSDSRRGNLVGTWRVTVNVRDCASGQELGPSFQALLTFAQGGTLTETTSNPMFGPLQRGPGHGFWTRGGDHDYNASSLAFLTANGVLVQTQRINQKIEMGDDPNAFTSAAVSEFNDVNGNLVRSVCAAATAKRFQ